MFLYMFCVYISIHVQCLCFYTCPVFMFLYVFSVYVFIHIQCLCFYTCSIFMFLYMFRVYVSGSVSVTEGLTCSAVRERTFWTSESVVPDRHPSGPGPGPAGPGPVGPGCGSRDSHLSFMMEKIHRTETLTRKTSLFTQRFVVVCVYWCLCALLFVILFCLCLLSLLSANTHIQ